MFKKLGSGYMLVCTIVGAFVIGKFIGDKFVEFVRDQEIEVHIGDCSKNAELELEDD